MTIGDQRWEFHAERLNRLLQPDLVTVVLVIGIVAVCFLVWDFRGREVPMSKVQSRLSQGKEPFTHPIGNTGLTVLALCVVFMLWYAATGRH